MRSIIPAAGGCVDVGRGTSGIIPAAGVRGDFTSSPPAGGWIGGVGCRLAGASAARLNEALDLAA